MPDDSAAIGKSRNGLLRRAKRRISNVKHRVQRRIAPVWRRQFANTAFIGITGSHGKTTAAFLLGKLLGTMGHTRVGVVHNGAGDVARTILGGLPWRHRYFVHEVGVFRPGSIDASLALLRPSIGIVTAIGGDHRKAFGGSWEATAAEKAKLAHCLPADGLAVLNADDPLVVAMSDGCRCRVVTYGRAGANDLCLVKASSAWPDRLALEVAYRGEHFTVKTRMVGTHWATSILAALLTAFELGANRSDCLGVIESREPMYNRMSVHPAPNGAWFVLDADKASYHGIETCLGFLESASTARKTVVVGMIADYPGASRPHYNRVARMALERADRVIFTGVNAPRVRRLADGEFRGRLFVAEQPEKLIEMLSEDALPGEIIYIKASRATGLAHLFAPVDQR